MTKLEKFISLQTARHVIMHYLKKNVQRVHGTKLITGSNNYCMLHKPMLLVLKTVNTLSQNQTVIFQRSNTLRKYCIAHLGIILVNIQGGCFLPIHQKMLLITYFEKAFENPCFKVIQCPFYWSTHSSTRILFVCLWQSAKDPWVATYFHHKDLVSVLWILTKLYTFGATASDRTGADRIFQNWIA